jgi:hypothetical protein
MRSALLVHIVCLDRRRDNGRHPRGRQRSRVESRRSVSRGRSASRRTLRIRGRCHPWGPQSHVDDGFFNTVRTVGHDDHGCGACPTVASAGGSIAVGAERRVAHGRPPAASAKSAGATALHGPCQDARRRSAGGEGHRQPRLKQCSVIGFRISLRRVVWPQRGARMGLVRGATFGNSCGQQPLPPGQARPAPPGRGKPAATSRPRGAAGSGRPVGGGGASQFSQ